jgi:predicted ABC-type ATPase
MHNFADGVMEFSSRTYADLFWSLTEWQPFFHSAPKNRTYCFELCSLENRIIRKYPKPVAFLITSFDNTDRGKELGLTELNDSLLPSTVRCVADASPETMAQEMANDPFFEGFVVQCFPSGQRYKVKNPLYGKAAHLLRFRGWSALTAEMMAAFDDHRETLLTMLRETKTEDADRIAELWNGGKSVMTAAKRCPVDGCGQHGHFENDDGMSQHPTQCFCGQPMVREWLRCDFVRHRLCVDCGVQESEALYRHLAPMWLWRCHACGATHQGDRVTGQPLGYPGSRLCKSMRLRAHELMDRLKSSAPEKWSRASCYELIAKVLGVELVEQAHMARCNIPDCRKVIAALELEWCLVSQFSWIASTNKRPSSAKQAVFVVGPLASGKSTYIRTHMTVEKRKELGLYYFDQDQFHNPRFGYEYTRALAVRVTDLMLANGRSMLLESTGAHEDVLEFMDRLKRVGYSISLVVIQSSSEEQILKQLAERNALNKSRVISAEVVRENIAKCRILLPRLIAAADRVEHYHGFMC